MIFRALLMALLLVEEASYPMRLDRTEEWKRHSKISPVFFFLLRWWCPGWFALAVLNWRQKSIISVHDKDRNFIFLNHHITPANCKIRLNNANQYNPLLYSITHQSQQWYNIVLQSYKHRSATIAQHRSTTMVQHRIIFYTE